MFLHRDAIAYITSAGNSIPVRYIVRFITVEEEHAIQMDFFVYTRFHSRNIFQVIAKKQVSKYKHVFSLEVQMVEILTDLNWKWKWGSEIIWPF